MPAAAPPGARQVRGVPDAVVPCGIGSRVLGEFTKAAAQPRERPLFGRAVYQPATPSGKSYMKLFEPPGGAGFQRRLVCGGPSGANDDRKAQSASFRTSAASIHAGFRLKARHTCGTSGRAAVWTSPAPPDADPLRVAITVFDEAPAPPNKIACSASPTRAVTTLVHEALRKQSRLVRPWLTGRGR